MASTMNTTPAGAAIAASRSARLRSPAKHVPARQ
jgi:hypothetical protein